MTQLEIQITPSHQEIAARLGLAVVDGAADRIDNGLSEIAAAGMSTALPVIALLAQHLATATLVLHGLDDARAVFGRTIIDAHSANEANDD